MVRIFFLLLFFIMNSLPAHSMFSASVLKAKSRYNFGRYYYGDLKPCKCIKNNKIYCFSTNEGDKEQKAFLKAIKLYEKKIEDHRYLLEIYKDHPNIKSLSLTRNCEHTSRCAQDIIYKKYDKFGFDLLKSEVILCGFSCGVCMLDFGINALTFLAIAVHPINLYRLSENMDHVDCDSLDEKAMTVQLHKEIGEIDAAIERLKLEIDAEKE